ncbi:hypothetical protein ILUMI_26174 [Ignelater luminosus]|uniref:Uncharacterized protein n=1 Tax=Ignelater luminosus TaxID=2038154 RepID=A0A8K0C4K7_IGNLU|nr:hypothetical protein ILUMI_26174 [Ignelater luminosus]
MSTLKLTNLAILAIEQEGKGTDDALNEDDEDVSMQTKLEGRRIERALCDWIKDERTIPFYCYGSGHFQIKFRCRPLFAVTKNGAIVYENGKHNYLPRGGTFGIPESVQAALPSVPTISKIAQRIRRRTTPAPRPPTSLSELVIDGPYSKTSSGEDFLLSDSGAGDPNRSLLFSTERNLKVLSSSDHCFCNGIFKTAPPLFTQLITIHAIKFDAVILLTYKQERSDDVLLPIRLKNSALVFEARHLHLTDVTDELLVSIQEVRMSKNVIVGFQNAYIGISSTPKRRYNSRKAQYNHIKECVHSAAYEALEIYEISKNQKSPYWWDQEIATKIEETRRRYLKYLNTKKNEDMITYKAAQAKVRKMIVKKKNERWEKNCNKINTYTGGRLKTMSTATVSKDIIEVDTSQLFQKILCTIHSHNDLRDGFKYELATIPMSLFEKSGFMRKTKKSALYSIFDRIPEGSTEIGAECFYVIDGGYLSHHVVWPKRETFGDSY